MKKFLPVIGIVLVLASSAPARGDLVSEYGVNGIYDSPYDRSTNLYQLFNGYFADQLGEDGLYNSSNALFNDRGIDPYAGWTMNDSQLVAVFKAAEHLRLELSLTDAATGSVIDSLYTANAWYDGDWTESYGITDLSQAVSIPDGDQVNFQLGTYSYNTRYTLWSSNPDDNVTGGIYMIALDVTDLYNEKWGTSEDSAYMFAWTDLSQWAGKSKWGTDLPYELGARYQDFVGIITNGPSEESPVVPEPGTMLVFGAGLIGLGLGYRRKFKKS